MSTIDYIFVGWCQKNSSDKIWVAMQFNGHFHINDKILTVWGRRGGKLSYKIIDDDHDAWVAITKKRLHYKQIPSNFLRSVYPEFEKDLEKMYILAKLTT
jgi:hypothetical protein